MRISECRYVKNGVTTLASALLSALFFAPLHSSPALAIEIIETPTVPLELPVEIETELAPAGSLKQSALWHEVAEMLENPGAIDCTGPDPTECTSLTERRASFGAVMPALNVWAPCFNVLTGQPLRRRTTDGEISWDQPGLLFGPDDGDATTPLTDVIGQLVVDAANNLVVDNFTGNPGLPTNGTPESIVAVPACNADGVTVDLDGNPTEFELPISELDFLRPEDDVEGILAPLHAYIGRPGAQVLGKALFWDMQVGSDGVQACGSCHFHAGTDNRTRNQLNPNHLGGDLSLQLHGGVANQDLQAADYPFHKLVDSDVPGEPLLNPENVASDTNDVASSMGVRFRKFKDIRSIGATSFGIPSSGVRALLPDLGMNVADPIPLFQGLRRVEPRNTPTIFGVAFNFDSFWDGRARHDSNGGSVFGPTDPQFHVFITDTGPSSGSSSGGGLKGASNGDFRPELVYEDPEVAEQPLRIRFSSLASLATGPALSNFEMSFDGRNWAKIGKKLLQNDVRNKGPQTSASPKSVVPLANQLVATTDSVLGPFSNQGGAVCTALSRPTAANKPGLCISYGDLIRLSFIRRLWENNTRHLRGTAAVCTSALNGVVEPESCDPFDGYVLTIAGGAASATNRNKFRQIEANFSLFFGQALQIWQELLIPDNTPFDQFMDANPLAANAVAQPGEQGTLPPASVRGLVLPNGDELNLVPGFGPEEIFGFDIFSGANLTAALPVGSARNLSGVGSNPFLRSARCMLCHLGPEQSDHTNNVNAGILHSGVEFELPPPGAPEPTGVFRFVTGAMLAEEVEENAQDGIEVENRDFSIIPGPVAQYNELSLFPDTGPQDVGIFANKIGLPSGIAFQDNGVYNLAVRPTNEDIMRGGRDAFGWPLSLAAMAMKNLAGADFEACDDSTDSDCAMPNFDADAGPGGGLFEPTGADQRINPGYQMEPAAPQLPEYLAPWANNLPAGELHPAIDELAFAPNTRTHPPFAEFEEILFGSDTNCGEFDPEAFGAGAPNFGWGPQCPNSQSAISNNIVPTMNGTFPFVNRVARNGAVKAPQLRNVELTGPYFHTGSYLTLRQIVDFYMRGGDFPMTNAEDRDPNLVNVGQQVFGFGSTNAVSPPLVLDGIPDVITRYDAMPDTDAATPETAAAEEAKEALVKFLLSMTDERVRFERAPFDHPEIFVPLDGRAPDNKNGTRLSLLSQTAGSSAKFRRVLPVGAEGSATPLSGFLGVSSTPVDGPNNDHFDR